MIRRLWLAIIIANCALPTMIVMGQTDNCVSDTDEPCPAHTSLEDFTFVSAQALPGIDSRITPSSASLSPDGATIAFFDRDGDQLCLYTLADNGVDCVATLDFYPEFFHWSPSGDYIAFTENFFFSLIDNDIWLYDVANRALRNVTDDSIERWALFPRPQTVEERPVWIDTTMAWGPDGNLYFLRTEFPDTHAEIEETLAGLYRVAPAGAEPEQIADLTGLFEPIAFAYAPVFSLDGTISISPDAEQAAFIVRESDRMAPNNGVWVKNINDDGPVRQVAGEPEFRIGSTPEQIEFGPPPSPTAVAWTADGQGIVVLADNLANISPDSGGRATLFYIEIETGDAVELTDLGDPEPDAFLNPDANGLTADFAMPQAALMVPDRRGLLVFNVAGPPGVAGVSSLDVRETGAEQRLLYRIDNFDPPFSSTVNASLGANGALLMHGYLFLPDS